VPLFERHDPRRIRWERRPNPLRSRVALAEARSAQVGSSPSQRPRIGSLPFSRPSAVRGLRRARTTSGGSRSSGPSLHGPGSIETSTCSSLLSSSLRASPSSPAQPLLRGPAPRPRLHSTSTPHPLGGDQRCRLRAGSRTRTRIRPDKPTVPRTVSSPPRLLVVRVLSHIRHAIVKQNLAHAPN
jgi:hypothetical protein